MDDRPSHGHYKSREAIVSKTIVEAQFSKSLYPCYYEMYAGDIELILLKGRYNKYISCTVKETSPFPTFSYEIGHALQQLRKGSVNHMWGVLSPRVEVETANFKKVRELISNNLHKGAMNSIRGIARGNLRQIAKGENPRLLHATRALLLFGIELMKGEINFGGNTRKTIPELLREAEEWRRRSKLPNRVSPLPFNQLLLDVRRESFERHNWERAD